MKNSFEQLFFPTIPYFHPSKRLLSLLLFCLSSFVLLSSAEDTIMCKNLWSSPLCTNKFLCLYHGFIYRCNIPKPHTGNVYQEESTIAKKPVAMYCWNDWRKDRVRTRRLFSLNNASQLRRTRRQTQEIITDLNAKTYGYSKEFRWEHPLVVLKILACVTLTVLVGSSVIVYLSCGMFYQDCLAHMCSEVALLEAYICILSVTTNIDQLNKTACTVTAVMLHYLFTVVFLGQTMEVYFMCRLLYTTCPRQFLRDPYSLLLIAWGVPALLTGFSSHFLYDNYVAAINNCWLHVQGPAMLVVVVPICICAGLHIMMLLAVFCVADPPSHKQTTEYFRARACLTTRWASLIILLLSSLSWSMGILALNLQYRSFYIVFCIASIFLGSSILVVRIATEKQVRMTILSRLFPNSGRQSLPWPMSSFDTVDDVSERVHFGWKTPAIVFGSQESIQTRY